MADEVTPDGLAVTADHLGDAMTALRKPARVLVFGSLYLAGELLALNGPLPD